MQLNTKRTFRFYWKHVSQYRGLLFLFMFALFVAQGLGLLNPYFFKVFFDTLVSEGEVSMLSAELVKVLFIILGIHTLEWVFWRINNFAVDYFQPRVTASIVNDAFDYLHRHSYNFFNNEFAGSLVKKVNRLARSYMGISTKIIWDFTPIVIKVSVIFGVLFWLHPTIGLLMLGWSIFFIAFNYWFSLYKLKYDLARAKVDSKVSGVLADTITNNVNIKLFSALPFELKRLKRVTADWRQKMQISWNLGSVAEAVQAMLMVLLEFAVLYFAVQLWEKGVLTVGDFVWIQAYLLDLFLKLWDFGRVVRELYEQLADAEEMIAILNQKHEIRDLRKASQLSVHSGRIEFKNVGFAYHEGDEVIRDMSFAIKPSEKVALIGPSGGGKSTITKLILRLFDIQRGQIEIDGTSISEVTQDSLRSQIAFVPQDPILFHRSLMDNIRYGRRDASDEEVIEAARLAYCHDFISALPKQYGTFVGERGVKLSGGERQRVAIARAILSNAPILILDEATSALDSESELLIQQALENLMKQKTTLVIAHRLSTIMRMDRILVIQNGAIVEEGTHGDLLSDQSGLYKKLWDLQVGGYVNQ